MANGMPNLFTIDFPVLRCHGYAQDGIQTFGTVPTAFTGSFDLQHSIVPFGLFPFDELCINFVLGSFGQVAENARRFAKEADPSVHLVPLKRKGTKP